MTTMLIGVQKCVDVGLQDMV